MKNFTIASLAFIFSIVLINPLSSQTMEMSMVPDSISALELDFTRALIDGSDQSLLSGNFNLQYKHIINEKLNFIGELTYVNFRFGGGSADGISNIYAGIQYKTSNSANTYSALNAGIYLPTSSEEAQSGAFNNLFDLTKYLHETTGIHVGYNQFINYSNGFRLGFEFGSDLVIPIGDNDMDMEILGKYGLSLAYFTQEGLYFNTEFLGVASVTEEGGFDENTFHTYAVGLGYAGNSLSAGLYYRNYFDDFFEFDGILGIKLGLFL